MSFLGFLAEKKIINSSALTSLSEEIESSGKSLEEALKDKGVDPYVVLEARGQYLNIPIRKITESIPFDVLNYIPEKSASYYKIVPLGVEDGALEVGAVDPENPEGRDALQFISAKLHMPFKIFLISQADLTKVLGNYKGLTGEVSKALNDLESELSIEASQAKGRNATKENKEEEENITEDAPVTKIVADILRFALRDRASDIHIEHMGENIRVRFRIDGVLVTNLTLPPNIHSAVVARIKILSGMKLDEKRKPQDGRFSAHIDGRKIDFRVSTFPAYYGEKVVMRILDTKGGIMKLEDLGVEGDYLRQIREAIQKPYGLILISGPTGSGKSTTLYSMLNEINREQNNVLSLEDPIEYNIPGVSQSQVRPEIGYSFASGLRTTLRQDPDIIMVGEIRDKVTARLAIQAALTGHLVLSTIHTNNAFGVIPRLVDMGVDRYLIAPTLVLAIAQRLVRTLAPGVPPKAVPVDASIKAIIDNQFADLPPKVKAAIPFTDVVYEAVPSTQFPNGTKGRTVVMEILEMDKNIEQIILNNPTEEAITKAARAKGMLTMKEDAIIKAMKGEIPFDEVLKL